MQNFDKELLRILTYLKDLDGTTLLVCVCDDSRLQSYVTSLLRKKVESFAQFREFIYQPQELDLVRYLEPPPMESRRQVVAVSGLDILGRDHQSEAIKLLNLNRNQFGRTGIAVLFWVTHALLRRLSSEAADFFSWRSATVFIPPPPNWDQRQSELRKYLASVRRGLHAIDLTSLLELEVQTNGLLTFQVSRHFLNLDEQHGAPYVRSTLEEVTLHTRVIVLGSPGSGKTTLLKGIALELASQEKPGRSILSPTLSSKVPLYLSSADSQFLSSSELEARARLAFDAIAGKSDGRLFKSLLRNGELLLLLDGLDEAPQKLQRGVIAELLKFVEKYPMCHVVAATRPLDYDASLLNAWPRYELQPLDEIEQSEFVKALLQDPRKATAMLEMLRRNPQLETMAASPLTLLVMAVVFQSHADIPRSNFALLSIFTEELISQELRRGRVGREDASVSRITHLLLPELGWDLQKRNLVAISQSELVRLVTSILSGYSLESTTAEAFVRNVRSYVGVFLAISIDADGREMYGFIHRSIQEYFAATYLARQWQRVGARILAEISQEPQWPSVIALASGGFGPREASRFVREILGGKHSDCQNVLLAGECILAGAEVDPELRQHVASQLFTSVAEGNLRLDQMVLTTHLLSELVRSDWPTMRTVLRAALKQGKPDLRLAAMQILATSPLPDWANSEAALIATPLTRDPDDRISLYASEVINRSERSGSPSKFGV